MPQKSKLRFIDLTSFNKLLRSLEDYEVDRLGVEALRGAELTSTNRPCDLTSFTKANIVVGARTPGGI